MIKNISIFEHNLLFLFRKNPCTKKWRIGLWFQISKLLTKDAINNFKAWNDNLINNYTIGVDIVFWEFRFVYNKNGVTYPGIVFKEEKNN